jgi:hypothetical protein
MFFWVFPRRQYVICRRFETMCQFHLQKLEVDYSLLLAFEDRTDTWLRNVGKLHIDTAGKYPKEHIQDDRIVTVHQPISH